MSVSYDDAYWFLHPSIVVEGEKIQPCLSMKLGHAVELLTIKSLLGLFAPCLSLANLNIFKCRPPCFSLELVVPLGYQPQYLA